MLKKQTKEKLESLGERFGDRLGQSLSKNSDKKSAQIGKKVAGALGKHAERLHDALAKKTVTKEEQLGVGGKIGTGLGIIGKHLDEKRYGLLSRLVGTDDLVSEGRSMGAKAEKILKRAVKTGVERIPRTKERSK